MITLEQAMQAAIKRASEKGWPLPVNVKTKRVDLGRRIGTYLISSNPRLRGSRSWFVVDAETGQVIGEGFISR